MKRKVRRQQKKKKRNTKNNRVHAEIHTGRKVLPKCKQAYEIKMNFIKTLQEKVKLQKDKKRQNLKERLLLAFKCLGMVVGGAISMML